MRVRTMRYDRRPGVAAVEAALVLPLLFILLFGVWEVSRMIQLHQAVSNAAREGGRQASAGQSASNANIPAGQTPYSVQNYVARYLMNSGLPAPRNRPFTVRVTNLTQSGRPSCTMTGISDGATPPNLVLTQQGPSPSVDPVLGAARNDIISVQVTFPFEEARISPVNFYVFFGTWNLTFTAYWVCMTDIPVSIDATIPTHPL